MLDQILLSFRTIREVSVLPQPKNLMVGVTPQTLLTPVVKEIFADATSGNTWNNRTPRRISRTSIDGYTPISTPIHSGIRNSSTPASIESTGTRVTGTRIPIGTTAPPCGLNLSPNIYDIRKSATPYLRKSNKLDTSIDGHFTNNLVAPPIFTEVLCEKLSESSNRDIYTLYWLNLLADPVNIPAPQFVDLGISTIDALSKGASLWTPATRVGRSTDATYWIAPDHIFGRTTAIGDSVSAKSDYKYKTDFETWRENQEFERQNNTRSRPPSDSTPVGVKTSDPQTLTT